MPGNINCHLGNTSHRSVTTTSTLALHLLAYETPNNQKLHAFLDVCLYLCIHTFHSHNQKHQSPNKLAVLPNFFDLSIAIAHR